MGSVRLFLSKTCDISSAPWPNHVKELVSKREYNYMSLLFFPMQITYNYWSLSLQFSWFPYWPGHLMFSTLLATMFFHFILDFALFHIGLNHLTISSSHYVKVFQIVISGLLDTTWHGPTSCLWTLQYVWSNMTSTFGTHDHIFHSTPLPNYLASDVLMQWYSQQRYFHCPLCYNQLLFFLLCGSPRFAWI